MTRAYSALRASVSARYPEGVTPGGVSVDDIVQLRLQNTYDTHLDVARAMATVMRADMAAYDADVSKFTQSLGCWSGFHAQQMIKAVKRLRGTARGTYVYLSGWMVAGLRNRWGHLPDQSMHEKTAVADLIEEILRLAAPGGRSRAERPLCEAPCGTEGRRRGLRESGDRRDRRLREPRCADHRRHRRRLRQRARDLPSRQGADPGGRLLPPDREPGLRRQAVRPSGWQGDRSSRGLHREASRLPARLRGAWCRRRGDRRSHGLRSELASPRKFPSAGARAILPPSTSSG